MSNEFWGLAFTFLPFIVIIMLANIAQARREKGQFRSDAAIFSYILLIALYLATFVGGILVHIAGILSVRQPELLEDAFPADLNINLLQEADSLTTLGIGFWLPSLIGILLLWPPFRRLVARIIPIDAQSPVHAVALSYIMLIIINLMLTLGVAANSYGHLSRHRRRLADSSVVVSNSCKTWSLSAHIPELTHRYSHRDRHGACCHPPQCIGECCKFWYGSRCGSVD